MGENFVNYQIRSSSISSVVNAVENITKTKAYVSPPQNGWITVYDQLSEDFESDEIYRFAQELSSRLLTATFALIVNSRLGYNFIYLLYESGQLVDEFFDDPESFEFDFKKADNTVIERFKGKPENLIKYCISGTTIEEISYVLNSCRGKNLVDYLGDGGAWHFAILFGIDEYRATNGYHYFEKDSLFAEEPDLEDAKDFVLVEHQ